MGGWLDQLELRLSQLSTELKLKLKLSLAIRNASPSYTIPADVALKGRRVPIPARLVFDPGSKTSFMEDLDNSHNLVEDMPKEADEKGADLPMKNFKKSIKKYTNSDDDQLDTNRNFYVEKENLED